MELADLIDRHRSDFSPVFKPALNARNTVHMGFSVSVNPFDGMSEAELDAAIFGRIDDAGAIAGVGGYLEKRSVYRDTELFKGDGERCIHIGIDVFIPAGTPVYAPLDGVVQSFANRDVAGDYGPLIILRHDIDGFEFHSLYGHLSEDSLRGLSDAKPIVAGDRVAEIGARPINGNWPPHLHFQLIRDMQGYHGDYPGVVRASELEFSKRNCPDPGPALLTT